MSNDAELYAQIEERFCFALPPEYKLLRECGYMTLDRAAKDISTVPGDGYLWIHDMEWYSLKEIAEFEFPEYCQPHLQNLVPFAFTGGGDYWCWQTDKKNEHGTRVLLCLHDSYDGSIYAPNFHSALYRQALLYAEATNATDSTALQEARAYLRRWAADLFPVFPQSWCKTLLELADGTPVNWSIRHLQFTTLLTPDGRKEIEQRDLQFQELDANIRWMNLDEAC